MLLNEVYAGLEGRYKGLNTGLSRFNKFINGVQKKMIYLLGAQQKSGKTAFVDTLFVLGPYLNNPNVKIKWIYFSFEIDLIEKMAKFCAYFMDLKHGIYCDSNYILSRGDNKLKDEHIKLVEEIYNNELIDLFGKFDKDGNIIKEGKIDFIEDRLNPTGINKYIWKYAENNGKFNKAYYIDSEGEKQTRIVSYTENDPELYTIIILDHQGLQNSQQGMNKKETIDKTSSNFVRFRNMCKFTMVIVSQFNRSLSATDRLKFSGEQLQPVVEDFKESGEPANDASMVIALFNPTSLPHIDKHLGYNINKIGKNYRSAHILASRNTESGVNIGLLLEGKTGRFIELPKANNEESLNKVYNYINNKLI